MVKSPPASAGDIRDLGSIPGSGRSPRRGRGNPLQYACLENPMVLQNLKPGGIQSLGSQRVGHDWALKHIHGWRKEATSSSLFPPPCPFVSHKGERKMRTLEEFTV